MKDVDGFSREQRQLVRTEGKSQKNLQTKNQNQDSATVFKGSLDHNTVRPCKYFKTDQNTREWKLLYRICISPGTLH